MLQQIREYFQRHTTAGIVASIHRMIARLEAHAEASKTAKDFHDEQAALHNDEHAAAVQVREKLADIVGTTAAA